MTPFLSLIEVLFAFSFMIFIHEGGHYLVCRLFGVGVEEFALGFGPTLVSRKWGKTLYAIRAIPLGGFCKPQGGDLSGETAEKMYEKKPEPGDFLYASWWKRVIIFLAGPGMNYLSAVVLIFILYVVGQKVPLEEPVLGFIQPDSLAAQAGFQKGDRLLKADGAPIKNLFTDLDDTYKKLEKTPSSSAVITVERAGKPMDLTLKTDPLKPDMSYGLFNFRPAVIGSVPIMSPAGKAGIKAGDTVLSVNGKKVSEWNELAYDIKSADSDKVSLSILRDNKSYPVTIERIYNGLYKAIGISPTDDPNFEIKKMAPAEALFAANGRAVDFIVTYAQLLGKLATGKMSLKDNIGGPIAIMRTMYQKAAQGWSDFAETVALISLVLCFMNLIPFLAVVDGGQIVLCLLEGIKRQPMPVKFQEVYQKVGFVLVGMLMVMAVFNDLWGWVIEKFHSQIP